MKPLDHDFVYESDNKDYTPHIQWAARIIAFLILFTAVVAYLSVTLGCATGDAMRAGCITTPCGDVCCPNDGLPCPLCNEYSYNDGCNDCDCKRVNAATYSCTCTLIACEDDR